MPLAIGALIFGGILLVAAFRGSVSDKPPLLDTILGRKPNPSPGVLDNLSVGSITDVPAANVSGILGAVGGTTIIDLHPVANWIVPIVRYARKHGWQGNILSGYRPRSVQQSLWNDHVAGRHPGPVARPGTSNHEKTAYPGGAIDVSDPDGFETSISGYPGILRVHRGIIDDAEHFSARGN